MQASGGETEKGRADALSRANEALSRSIDALVDFAAANLALEPSDVDWARNCVLNALHFEVYSPTTERAGSASIDQLLAQFMEAVRAADRGGDDGKSGEVLAETVMGLLTPLPSQIEEDFTAVEADEGPMEAMQWFYDLCVSNTYVKRSRLELNERFDSHGLVVTINLAKPEFKNMKKAAAGNSLAGGYPQCTICHENEGFAGSGKNTLRTLPVTLGGESWFWQFSPYGYFNQHGICVNAEHTPMHVDRSTFAKLLDFVDRFPGYFLGCNAALPRIGGSVLAHDHYQGGGEQLPMQRARAWRSLRHPGYEGAVVEILDWPGTAVRVVSQSRSDIIEVSEEIRRAWVSYTSLDGSIVARGSEGQQSALSPSVRVSERGYEMSLIFRNNAVNAEFPEGIFHAHPQFWPIKQEPIGLIEAQGLFILPGRLVRQLGVLEKALARGEELPSEVSEFSLEWNEVVDSLGGATDPAVIHAAVRDEVGSVCERILQNTAVFKKPEDTLCFLRAMGLRPMQ